MEIKSTLARNRANALADGIIAAGADHTAPTVWLPQRLPWNPGGFGGGSLWGWPSGRGEAMTSAFQVWTFAHDASGLARVELLVREDSDGVNDPATPVNETYAGGAGVSAWLPVPLNHRAMPLGEPGDIPGVDLTVLPSHIADEYWVELSGYRDILLDYCVEAEDSLGNIKRTPIQHVYVGTEDAGGGAGGEQPFVMDGNADAAATPVAAADVNLLAALPGSGAGQRLDRVVRRRRGFAGYPGVGHGVGGRAGRCGGSGRALSRRLARLGIYDARGRLVRRWRLDHQVGGKVNLIWDGRDAQGAPVPSGVYLARVETSGASATRRISLVK